MVGRRVESLRDALGVSRVARVTGLDRTGVEVACAIRPGGHVLQVANGKGLSFAAAERSALAEAAELWASERVDAAGLRWGPAGPHREGPDLVAGGRGRVRAADAHCTPAGGPLLGPPSAPWTTNGLGAHASWAAAALHALLEAVEREELARALPRAFTPHAVRARLLRRDTLPREARSLAAGVEARGFRAFFLDATAGLGVPVAAALLFDEERGAVPVGAGYAARLTPGAALVAALLEAAQSRLTDIHGAREDVAAMGRREAAALRRMCERARPRRGAGSMPRLRARGPRAALRAVAARLARAGVRSAVAVDLAPPGFPLHVVKVVVPGFRVSELL
jgi:ribosomal protein S12 methylthiotransferase accessory factor